MQNLHFSTIEALSKRFMDFLVLIPSSMDANRNEQNYVHPEIRQWRISLATQIGVVQWSKEKAMGKSFEHFVVEEFGRSMQRLGYIDPGIKEAI